MRYIPPTVSERFRYDWQFAVDMSKLPLLRPASIVIGFMPLITRASQPIFGVHVAHIPQSAWVMWWSSVFFIGSWLIIRIRCPHLIQQYRHYGEYSKENHSHRWIVWLFYNSTKSLRSWTILPEVKLLAASRWLKNKFKSIFGIVSTNCNETSPDLFSRILEETYAKGISVRVNDFGPQDVMRICPYMVKKEASGQSMPFDSPTNKTESLAYYPINHQRDIYVPIHCNGERRVLMMLEDDPELAAKEKELFWILYTELTKQSPISRFFFWLFFYASVLLLGWNVLVNVYLVVAG